MQHHYFARYPTDEWHLANVFSLVYFSVVVCLRGLYHHILLATARALCQGQCTPHARFPLTKGGGLISGSPLLGRTGVLNWCWALSSLLSWIPGWLESISIDITQNMMYAISRIHNGHKVVVCFRHATPSHYHHYAWLLACVEHKKCLPGISCRECV